MEEERRQKQKAEDYEHGKRLWFSEFDDAARWAKGFVGEHSDEILADFAATHEDRKAFLGEIQEMSAHLERLQKIFKTPGDYTGESTQDRNGPSPRGQKKPAR
jgi:hypothetical protein